MLRADGLKIATLLEGIMPLLVLDQYADNPTGMMAAVPGDELDPSVEEGYLKAIRISWPDTKSAERIERFAFYERARGAPTPW